MAGVLNNLGSLSFDRGKLEQAVDHLERALGLVKKTFNDEHPDVRLYQKNLEYVQQQLKKQPH